MLRTRVIPVLLLRNQSLVKTIRFGKFRYVGDPANTLRIFNELEVDELALLDITASREARRPDFDLIGRLTDECFMPLAYGGGIRTVDDARTLLSIGLEKVIINSEAIENPGFISALAEQFGGQCVIVSIDVKRDLFGRSVVRSRSGTKRTHWTPVEWAREAAKHGAGEILLTSIDHEGTWSGMDTKLIENVCGAVDVPVIAHGGASSIEDVALAVRKGASAVALGSMVVYQGPKRGVLVNFPDRNELEGALVKARNGE